MKLLSVFITALSISLTVYSSESKTQYFEGAIQVSSLDGKTAYGPAYPSIAKRIVDIDAGQITECVFQKGKLFRTEMTKTENPLVFNARDVDDSFTGKLIYSDMSLSSWSYDIDVVLPSKGKITGSLPENGAVIDESSGKMTIRKVWSNQALISENYTAIDDDTYHAKVGNLNVGGPIPDFCK